MPGRYVELNSIEYVRSPPSSFEMACSVRGTTYRVAGQLYRVVRANGHFYDDDTDLFLTCRGLLFDDVLRITEARAGTLHCYSHGDASFHFTGKDDMADFFADCGATAIDALESTLLRIDGVRRVEWGVLLGDLFDPLDATDFNAFHQVLEADHPPPSASPTSGGHLINCGNYSSFQSFPSSIV